MEEFGSGEKVIKLQPDPQGKVDDGGFEGGRVGSRSSDGETIGIYKGFDAYPDIDTKQSK